MKKLIKLLEVTNTLFLDLAKSKAAFKDLSEDDLSKIDEILGTSWRDLSTVEEKIVYICRTDGGDKMRKALLK